jgi:hypothetical protein
VGDRCYKRGRVVVDKPLTMAASLARDQSQLASVESVAAILTRCKASLIENWLAQAKNTPDLSHPHLSDNQRTEHIPQMVDDLVARLERPNKSSDAIPSLTAVEHGRRRRAQGYSSSMLIHEWRILQESIFGVLHENLSTLEFDLQLRDVMIVVGELDTQLIRTLDACANAKTDAAAA